MATLGDIQAKVLAKLVDAGGSIAEPTAQQVIDEINSSIGYFNQSDFWFNDAVVASGTLTIGAEVVPLPTDFDRFANPLFPFNIVYSNVRYPIRHIDPVEYDLLQVGGTGLPTVCTYRTGKLYTYFLPDQAYTYYLHYKKSYPALFNATDTNDFTINTDRLIQYKTLATCYADYRSDATMAAYYDGKVSDELRQIKRQTKKRKTTGVLFTENINERARYASSYTRGL